ncbi:transporter substrate-binding domain-containing protein [Paracrocinitomix mangrovi]|nr:transporter substrate-binding domain-containing protein [Paracrocinitomix mangrovi]
MSADYLQLMEKKIGVDFVPYDGIESWSQSLELLHNQEIYFLPALAQNEERSKFLDFTEAYLAYDFVIVTRKEGEFIGQLEDLEGKKVAAPENYYITGLLEQEQFKMNFVYKSGVQECLWAVATEEVDATVANLGVVSHYLNYNGFENLKIAAPTDYPKIEVKMGVAKGNPELVSILQKGINAISPKEKNEIVQNWVSVQFEHGVDMARIWRIAGISAGVILLIFGSFIYWNRKLKKEVSLRKEAEGQLRLSFDEISEQKKIIEHKNEEVLDSIKYAKRLQEAILPPTEMINNKFPNNFVLYLPKDIVAGDFYWMESVEANEEHGEINLIAAADCTGHGVPGAMVSVVCSNALNQSVLSHNLIKPGQILDKTTELVVERFERSIEEVKDGMDISLISVEYKSEGKAVVCFSGAHNNAWIVTKRSSIGVESNVLNQGDFYLHEIKANKQPVGKYENLKPFDTTEIELEKGDTVYLYSDGYADQFGGEQGKKFKNKSFKNLILDVVDKPLNEQKSILEKTHVDWKGAMEQLDDVCVIGVRI